MRRCFLFIIILFNVNLIFGQDKEVKEVKPFGLYEGMSLKDIEVLEEISESFYEIIPPDPSTEFESYYIVLTEDLGLCKIIATKIVETNVYGTNVKSDYNKFKEMLTSNYGKPKSDYDLLLPDSIWDEPKDWLISLEKEERIIASIWELNQVTIGLQVNIHNYYYQKCMIKLTYELSNFEEFFDNKEEDTKNKL